MKACGIVAVFTFCVAPVITSAVDSLSPRDSQNCTLYTAKPGDTCFGIASGHNATYAQLVAWNSKINKACTNLANLTSICVSNPAGNFILPNNGHGQTSLATTAAPIPTPTLAGTNSDCGRYYYVDVGDNCSTITEKFGIALSDFLFLNTEVWANCTNLEAKVNYCVEAVGIISTYPGYGSTTTTTSPFNQTAATPLPNIGNILANYTNTQPVIPIANGTRLDCFSYIFYSNVTDNLAADCWALSMIYEVTPEEFILWNPSLAQTNESSTNSAGVSATANAIAAGVSGGAMTATLTTNPYAYPCTLSANTSYCAALMSPTRGGPASTSASPSPRASGEISNCTSWTQAMSYDTCGGIINTFGLTSAEFISMNPSVDSDCSQMAVGTYYCISTYPNGMEPGVPYRDIVSSTVTTSSPTGIITPKPVQSGMVKDCDKFYDVKSGDGCSAIAKSYSVALSNFYAWNPAVKTDCTGLEASVYVCVGVEATSSIKSTSSTKPTGIITPAPVQTGMVKDCDKFYDVKAGDGCSAIAKSYSVALSNFYSWNPAVKTDCTGLEASVYVCVGVESSAANKPTKSTKPTGIVTPAPIQTGMVKDCDRFYDVKAGDGCYSIAQSYSIALTKFYSWNPAVKTDCSGLEASVYVCIGTGPAAAPTKG